jgi:hypothetical protein
MAGEAITDKSSVGEIPSGIRLVVDAVLGGE